MLFTIRFCRNSIKAVSLFFCSCTIDGWISVVLLSDDHIPEALDVTQFVAVKIHHQFPQAPVARREVHFHLGLLSRLHCSRKPARQ